MSTLSHPLLPGPQDTSGRNPPRAPPTGWRGWRQMRRLTGGGGRPPRRRPCPRRCESGAHSPPSGTASSPPGPSGSQSGPGESLSVNWVEIARDVGVSPLTSSDLLLPLRACLCSVGVHSKHQTQCAQTPGGNRCSVTNCFYYRLLPLPSEARWTEPLVFLFLFKNFYLLIFWLCRVFIALRAFL